MIHRFRNFFLLLLLCLSLSLSSLAGSDFEAFRGKVPDGYDFWLHTPSDVSATAEDSVRGRALIVFLHGASLCGNNLDRVRHYGPLNAIEKGRRVDAYLVAPQNPGGSWSPRKVMNVVDYVSRNYPVDSCRVYVMGMSLGGYGSIDVAATYPDRIAAAIGLCGGASVTDLKGLAKVPLWVVHGTGDRAVSVSQSDRVVEAVKSAQAGGTARVAYDRVPGMNHGQPVKVFYHPATYEWLLSHRLDDPGRPLAKAPTVNQAFLKGAYAGLDHSKGVKHKASKKSAKKSARKKSKARSGSKKTRAKKR